MSCPSRSFSNNSKGPAIMTRKRLETPYVGLVPYTEEDSRLFFGREKDQQVIVSNLFASRLTILYGASGVGKSSLLRAGVVKELNDRAAEAIADEGVPDLAVVYFNDGPFQDSYPKSVFKLPSCPAPDALAGATSHCVAC